MSKTNSPRAAKRPWTEYETWDALYADEGAYAAYWAEVSAAVNDLELDWTEVRKALSETVHDDREWAGRINRVGGVLRVVELVPSPHRVGEGPLARQAAAMVPAEVMAALEAKPGLFLFHTHPSVGGASAAPSAVDMAGAMHIGLTGRYAAELVVSAHAIIMYAPTPKLRRRIWAAGHGSAARPARAHLTMLRHVADLLGAFDGARSWDSPWTLEEYAALARRYGVDYVVFPSDSYVALDRRRAFSAHDAVDHDTHQDYIARIAELEKKMGDAAPDAAGTPAAAASDVKFVAVAAAPRHAPPPLASRWLGQ